MQVIAKTVTQNTRVTAATDIQLTIRYDYATTTFSITSTPLQKPTAPFPAARHGDIEEGEGGGGDYTTGGYRETRDQQRDPRYAKKKTPMLKAKDTAQKPSLRQKTRCGGDKAQLAKSQSTTWPRMTQRP